MKIHSLLFTVLLQFSNQKYKHSVKKITANDRNQENAAQNQPILIDND